VYHWLTIQLTYLESSYHDIQRKCLPAPHRYTSLAAFDTDVKALREGHSKLEPLTIASSSTTTIVEDRSHDTNNYNLLPDFEKRLIIDRCVLEQVLARPKMGGLFGAIGGGGGGVDPRGGLLAGVKLRSSTTPSRTASVPSVPSETAATTSP
jgi:hypothetical protein